MSLIVKLTTGAALLALAVEIAVRVHRAYQQAKDAGAVHTGHDTPRKGDT